MARVLNKSHPKEPTSAAEMAARLILHAGTHKTASTYIQDRLFLNRRQLSNQGFVYDYPAGTKTFKLLARDLCKGNWQSIQQHIASHKNKGKNLLISAEQLAVPLNNPKTLRTLKKLARREGFELEVLIFIRTQLDYINSRYAYSLRRFYHSQTFDEFLEAAITGRLPGESLKRGRIQKRDHLFDFWSYFQPLLQARRKGLPLTFIPFRQGNRDPFDQLLEAIGVPSNLAWTPASQRSHNRSPGIRGVWLSRLVSRRLQDQGISHHSIEGSSKIILKEETWRGWHDAAFWGFNRRLARSTHAHFRAHNQRFAKEVWGCRWDKMFPQDQQLLERKRCTFRPSSLKEELKMHAIADHLVRMIDHRCHPQPWHLFSDNAEKLLSKLHPTLISTH